MSLVFFVKKKSQIVGKTCFRYVPPITASGEAQGGSVTLPESPDAIEEEIKKQESLLAGLGCRVLYTLLVWFFKIRTRNLFSMVDSDI
jgi:hypothetical protein